jgi:hypothetical protein
LNQGAGLLHDARMRSGAIELDSLLVVSLLAHAGLIGCGSEDTTTGDETGGTAAEETGGLDAGAGTGGTTLGTGGNSAAGGAIPNSGGQTSAATGGSTTGGTGTGGVAMGGATASAGAAGETPTGGAATGGAATGGAATGGETSGGRGGATSAGGRSIGGSGTGGVATGGVSTGGETFGGRGGTTSTGGSDATGGSAATGGTENSGGSTGCYTEPAQQIGTQAPSVTVSGYGTVMIWAKAPRQVVWLQTTIVVPPKPPASGTLFLWPGIQPNGANFQPIDNGVLQPVLTWGPACAPGRQPRAYSTWWISGQYVNTNGDLPGYTDCNGGPIMSVDVCDTLDIDIALSGSIWTQTVTDEQTNETVTYDIDMLDQSQNIVYFVIEEYSSTPVSEVIFTDTTIAFDSPDAADCRVYMRGQADYVSTPAASSDGLQCSIQQIILRAEGIAGG